MHPPKVDERSYIEFPEPSDITIQQMIDGHTALIEDVNDLKDSTKRLEESNQSMNIGYAGIGLGISRYNYCFNCYFKEKNNH